MEKFTALLQVVRRLSSSYDLEKRLKIVFSDCELFVLSGVIVCYVRVPTLLALVSGKVASDMASYHGSRSLN